MDNIVESTTGDFPSKWVSQVGHYQVLFPFSQLVYVLFSSRDIPDFLISCLVGFELIASTCK